MSLLSFLPKMSLLFSSLLFSSLLFSSLLFSSLLFSSLLFSSLLFSLFSSLLFSSLSSLLFSHFTSLHFTSLHFTSLHFTSLHFTSRRLSPGFKYCCFSSLLSCDVVPLHTRLHSDSATRCCAPWHPDSLAFAHADCHHTQIGFRFHTGPLCIPDSTPASGLDSAVLAVSSCCRWVSHFTQVSRSIRVSHFFKSCVHAKPPHLHVSRSVHLLLLNLLTSYPDQLRHYSPPINSNARNYFT